MYASKSDIFPFYNKQFFNRFETTKELAQQEDKVSDLEKDLSSLQDKMKEIKGKKEEKSKEMSEKSAAWNTIQKQKDEITEKFDKIRKHDESLHAELVETNKRRKANITSLKTVNIYLVVYAKRWNHFTNFCKILIKYSLQEKSKLEELSRVPEKSMKDIQECQQLIEQNVKAKEKEEAVLEKLMAEIIKETEPLLNQRSKLEKELIRLRKDVDEAQAAYDIAQSELELYISVEAKEKEKLDNLKHSAKLTADNLILRKEELENLENNIPNKERELAQSQRELQTIKPQEIELTTKLKRMRISFEEKRSAMQASKSRNRIIDSLMREKREGRIPGVFGRLVCKLKVILYAK